MNFEKAMLIPTLWQLLLAAVGLGIAIMQHKAIQRAPVEATLSPWKAKLTNIMLFFGIAVLCFIGIPLLCRQSAPLLFPQTDFYKDFLLLIPAIQGLTLLCLLSAVKIFPDAFPPDLNAPIQQRSANWLSPKNVFGVPAFFVLGIFAVVASSVLVQGVILLFPESVQALFRENQMLVNALTSTENKLGVLLCIPAIAIFTPIIEELIFRAGIYRFLKSKMPALPAAIVSSVFFALMHDSYASYLPLTLFGCVLCFAYEKTGRIAAPMIIHGLFNANTLLCLALMGK